MNVHEIFGRVGLEASHSQLQFGTGPDLDSG